MVSEQRSRDRRCFSFVLPPPSLGKFIYYLPFPLQKLNSQCLSEVKAQSHFRKELQLSFGNSALSTSLSVASITSVVMRPGTVCACALPLHLPLLFCPSSPLLFLACPLLFSPSSLLKTHFFPSFPSFYTTQVRRFGGKIMAVGGGASVG